MQHSDLLGLARQLTELYSVDRDSIPSAICAFPFSQMDFSAYLVDPGNHPYGRRVIYSDRIGEVILMNWALQSECLPHDHGTSEGWVYILKGDVLHTVYDTRVSGPRQALLSRVEKQGELMYMPRGVLHKMGTNSREPLITLHFYFPPVSGMEVFDTRSRLSCVVSDDCGAWWPDANQIVRGPAPYIANDHAAACSRLGLETSGTFPRSDL